MGRKAQEKMIDPLSRKRQKLAEDAFPYFQKMGLKDFKMDKLAALLKKSKTTIYKYFVGREDLIGLIVELKIKELNGFEDVLFEKNSDYIGRYENAVLHIAKALEGLSNKFLLDISEIYPKLWQKINSFRLNASQRLEVYYAEGIQNGNLKDIHPSVLILTDRLFFEALLSQDFLKQSNLTVEEALQDYFKLKCEGMVN